MPNHFKDTSPTMSTTTNNTPTTTSTTEAWDYGLSPLHRRCAIVASTIDHHLERGPLHSFRVSYERTGGRPWWRLAALWERDWLELQAGRWVLEVDRPDWMRRR